MKTRLRLVGAGAPGAILKRRGIARFVLPSLVAVGTVLWAAGEEARKFGDPGVVTARPTHAALSEKRQDVQVDGKIRMAEEPIKMKAIRSGKTASLIGRSAILSSGTHWTIVPKEALLHVPPHLTARVNGERQGTLVTWTEFYAGNRGWIQPQTVSLTQARGEAAIGAESMEVYRSSGRVVVAVCHRGPISVKPLKEAAEGVEGGPAPKSGAAARPDRPQSMTGAKVHP